MLTKEQDTPLGLNIAKAFELNPVMAGAWISCLQWAITHDEIMKQFTADTGISYSAPRSGLERMIDDATGIKGEVVVKFVDWFNANIWGWEPWDEEAQRKGMAMELLDGPSNPGITVTVGPPVPRRMLEKREVANA